MRIAPVNLLRRSLPGCCCLLLPVAKAQIPVPLAQLCLGGPVHLAVEQPVAGFAGHRGQPLIKVYGQQVHLLLGKTGLAMQCADYLQAGNTTANWPGGTPLRATVTESANPAANTEILSQQLVLPDSGWLRLAIPLTAGKACRLVLKARNILHDSATYWFESVATGPLLSGFKAGNDSLLPPHLLVRGVPQEMPEGFEQVAGHTIRLPMHRYLQAKFRQGAGNATKGLLYRWYPASAQKLPQWQAAGPYTLLPLEGALQWMLEVFDGASGEQEIYLIMVQPPWYLNPLSWMVAGLGILLTVTAAVLWLSRRRQQLQLEQHNRLAASFAGIQQKMVPHFLANALSALQDMLHQKQWQQATRYCTHLGLLLRQAYQMQSSGYQPLQVQWQACCSYWQVALAGNRSGWQLQAWSPLPQHYGRLALPAGLLQQWSMAVKQCLAYSPAGGLLAAGFRFHEPRHQLELTLLLIPAAGSGLQPPAGKAPFEHTQQLIALHNSLHPNQPVSLEHPAPDASGKIYYSLFITQKLTDADG